MKEIEWKLVSIFTLPHEVLSFGKPMLFDGTDFVKSIKEKTQEIALQLSYNVDLTTSFHSVQIFSYNSVSQGANVMDNFKKKNYLIKEKRN